MSVKASSWVWEHSPYRDATLIVHLAIADVVNDTYHYECWLTREALAVKAHTSVPTVSRAVKQMVDDGLLEVVERGGGRGRPTRYRFLMPISTGLWTLDQTGSDCTRLADGKPDQEPDHLTPETGSSERAIRRTEVTEITQGDRTELAVDKADPDCLRCHGSGTLISPTPGANGEPFAMPCPCTTDDYQPAPAGPTRPPEGFGMPAQRGQHG